MTIRRCPQCHATSDDMYGFCIKCGYEFTKRDATGNTCPFCSFQNPDEADYCVKCGAPLVFKNQSNNQVSNASNLNESFDFNSGRTSRLLIVLGYIFSILGGIIGLIIAIYLATRKDPVAKKHGRIQLAIFAFYLILIVVFVATGAITMNDVNQYYQIFGGNITSLGL